MRHRFSKMTMVIAAAAVSGVMSVSVTRTSGQAPAASAAPMPSSALKTPWGEPDLQGIWTDETDTPLQRPARYANQEFFTEAQRAEIDRARSELLSRERRAERGTERDVSGSYNNVFVSFKRTGSRTSLIVDPPNGRIPPLTPQAQKLAAAEREFRLALLQSTETCKNQEAACSGGKYDPTRSPRFAELPPRYTTTRMNRNDGPEDSSLAERCLTGGLPEFGTNNGSFRRIVQTPGGIAIFYDVGQGQGWQRNIVMNGSPHLPANIRQWYGDSRGHWEGNTLVIDVTNFSAKTDFQGSRENSHLVERWTRTGPNWLSGLQPRGAEADCRAPIWHARRIPVSERSFALAKRKAQMAQQIERLARFVAETTLEQVPKEVQRHAKLVVLDTIGVILAGASRPEVRGLRERLTATAGIGATIFAPGWPTSDPRAAALLNGIAGRSLELGEGNRYVSYQGAMQILPGVLSVGEWARSTGCDMLAALILGYDAGARLGAAMTTRPLAHQNGQAALLGAAAAGSRLRALNAADTSRAIRIAATLVLTPSYNNAVAGATALNVAGGMSGFVFGLAPDLALAGFTAQDDAIEEALSSLVGDGFEPASLLDELGCRWEIMRNWFRLRACCNPIYAALDALEGAIVALNAKAGDIERIDIATFRFATVMCNPDPPNYFASKYSLPHVAACLAVRGRTDYESVDDSALDDSAIAALRHRVHIKEDPAMNLMVPALKPARVTLTLKDGRQVTHACDSPRGDCLNPYEESEIRLKFRQLAGFALTPQGVGEVERAVDRFEHWTSATELTDLLHRHCQLSWSRAPASALE